MLRYLIFNFMIGFISNGYQNDLLTFKNETFLTMSLVMMRNHFNLDSFEKNNFILLFDWFRNLNFNHLCFEFI